VDTSTLANDKNQITLHIRPNAAIQKDGPHRRETGLFRLKSIQQLR
jgi:hypothetical protein